MSRSQSPALPPMTGTPRVIAAATPPARLVTTQRHQATSDPADAPFCPRPHRTDWRGGGNRVRLGLNNPQPRGPLFGPRLCGAPVSPRDLALWQCGREGGAWAVDGPWDRDGAWTADICTNDSDRANVGVV
eukprot:CAMPEP_0174281394 /NCGR_PEP_ID=MMETSP0809-20121228/1794_1 /TAXON_ID=73025 ORGANISM="Eutreptiella gymnastica-like, Strain CCMP1594" /NCGR_SAMPLE_ID=MMETSP0809 /ASSEMBLY_ACC=CAM_ASM_000658 /LENGTH=130 /DNA_ID=CAMNT_0015374947 /DNA_START=138 /DNA_END=528 /DNA_ORIENTATION=-